MTKKGREIAENRHSFILRKVEPDFNDRPIFSQDKKILCIQFNTPPCRNQRGIAGLPAGFFSAVAANGKR
jgi:hypothetical protein